jgi:hypothetical protein
MYPLVFYAHRTFVKGIVHCLLSPYLFDLINVMFLRECALLISRVFSYDAHMLILRWCALVHFSVPYNSRILFNHEYLNLFKHKPSEMWDVLIWFHPPLWHCHWNVLIFKASSQACFILYLLDAHMLYGMSVMLDQDVSPCFHLSLFGFVDEGRPLL